MTSSYISLEAIPDAGSLGIHFFISQDECYFEPLGYVMGGLVILDLFSILFSKPELYCGRFAPLCHSEILLHKVSDN